MLIEHVPISISQLEDESVEIGIELKDHVQTIVSQDLISNIETHESIRCILIQSLKLSRTQYQCLSQNSLSITTNRNLLI